MFSYGTHPRGKTEAFFIEINTFIFTGRRYRRWQFSVLKRPVIIVMLPFFLLAMYERHGQPLEVVAGQIIRCMFLRTKERPHQTNNFYAALERQAQAEKEVKAIVQKAKARAAGTAGGKSRGKTDRRRKA